MSKKTDALHTNKKRLQTLNREKIKLWVASISFQLLTVGLFYAVHLYVIDLKELPDLYLSFWGGLFITRASYTWISTRYLISEKPESLVHFRRILKIKNIISVMLLALIVFPVIFYSPFPLMLDKLFHSMALVHESLTKVA